MIVLLMLSSCAPQWWQATPWEGDDTLAVGVVCASSVIREDTEDFWVRVGVRWHEEVEFDWADKTLHTVNAQVVDSELGPVRVSGQQMKMRYDTYRIRPVPGEGEDGREAVMGPYELPWRPAGRADWVRTSAPGCTASIH